MESESQHRLENWLIFELFRKFIDKYIDIYISIHRQVSREVGGSLKGQRCLRKISIQLVCCPLNYIIPESLVLKMKVKKKKKKK